MKKLYVGGLPYQSTEQSVGEAFAQVGTVLSVKIIIDRMTNRSKGFGFVEMSSEDEAQKAIEFWNGQNFEGRNLTVNIAKPEVRR